VARKRLVRIREWLAGRGLEQIGDDEYAELSRHFADIPAAALRRLVREAGLPMSPLVEGVRQDNLEILGRTLLALQQAYEGGGPETQRRCREAVILAKDHARLAARRKPEKREMVEWMLVWLENPPVFRTWWRLKVSGQTRGSTDTGESRES
jgi:hypothetical protein